MTHSSNSNSGATTTVPSSRDISRSNDISTSASAPVTPSSGFNIPHSQTTPKISTFARNDFAGPTSATTVSSGSNAATTTSSSISTPILPTFSPSSLSPRNSIISTNPNAAARFNRALSTTGYNYTTTSNTPSSPKRASFSEFSNEQIIDLMEREQDAIVLKLMREIDMLKQENKTLKMNNPGVQLPISSPPSVRRSSSLSTSGSRSSSSSSKRSAMFGNFSFRENSISHPGVHHSAHSPSHDDIIKKYKSEACPITRRLSLNGKYEEIMDENRNLKRELKRLQSEIEKLKK